MSPENIRIAAPSAWMARQALRSSLFKGFEIFRIPYGIDTDIFMPRNKTVARETLGIPQHLKVIMFVADWMDNHRKGLDLLAEAIKELSLRRDLGVISMGRSASTPKLPGQHFPVGYLSNERLLSLVYSAADLLVCPTREDNLPNVILEAMSCGLPVVGFDVGGLPDMIRQGENGFLAPREDVRELCNAIAAILDEDMTRSRMSQSAREIASREYAIDVQAQRYFQLYEKLLNKSGEACPPRC
jgi:glycosyltransferase involved in cell wall biosynthesis